jgi:CO/xanthine dehydrogenase Mo-binding subunit
VDNRADFDLPLPDARERVTGALPLTIDQVMPGMAHAKVVRSLSPHALLRAVDVGRAARQPGVLATITGRDIAALLGKEPLFGGQRDDQPVLAVDKVRYAGEPVALVVAKSERAAAEAASLVSVDYDELPYVEDARAAMEPGAPRLHDKWPDNDCGTWRLRRGNIDVGWSESDRIYEHTYVSPSASHLPMEPHVALARYNGTVLEVWASTQAPYMVHSALTRLFEVTPDRVRVRTFNLGGGYGAKGGVKIEPLVACAAAATGVPVRLVLTRLEVFQTVAKHAAHVTIKTGARSDGTLVARKATAVFNAGAYAVSSPLGSGQAMTRAPGPYRISHVWIDSTARYTNTVPTGPFRGAMTSQLCWAYEQQIDEIGADLGLDPVEIRRRNILQEGDTYATGEAMHDVHFSELLDEAARGVEWQEQPTSPPRVASAVRPSPPRVASAVRPSPPRGKARGKGLAVMIKSTLTPSRSEVRLRLDDGGRLTVFSSSVEMGQGVSATLRQLASAHTHLPPEHIDVPHPDTAYTPFDLTTSSSRSTFSMGVAIKEAAIDLERQLADMASQRLEADASDLRFANGRVFVIGAESNSVSYESLLRTQGLGLLEADGAFQSEGGMSTLDRDTGQGSASIHWHEGAVAVEVEVDLETGRMDILRCHGVCYAGRVISSMRVRQQNEGNVIFGLGQALFEELVYDGGQITNANMSDYTIPSILDIPQRLTSAAVESSDGDADIHGVGEMTVPCVAPAIANALYRATGVRLRTLPMTPERVLRALDERLGPRT